MKKVYAEERIKKKGDITSMVKSITTIRVMVITNEKYHC